MRPNELKKNELQVKKVGGLYIIGTERHESRRIDNQLRGRSGRQGDPGASVFFISLEDDLMRIFGGESIDKMLKKLGLKENESIDHCLMVAAWQYLQYPEKIAEEIARILNPNGKLIISFSNRAFWHKAPNIWTYSSEIERIEYVRNILVKNGFCEPKVIKKFTKENSFLPFLNHDPFYCLISKKK